MMKIFRLRLIGYMVFEEGIVFVCDFVKCGYLKIKVFEQIVIWGGVIQEYGIQFIKEF